VTIATTAAMRFISADSVLPLTTAKRLQFGIAIVARPGSRRYERRHGRAKRQRTPLTADERDGIILAVSSAFRKLKNLYAKIVPIFEDFGFTPPSPLGATPP